MPSKATTFGRRLAKSNSPAGMPRLPGCRQSIPHDHFAREVGETAIAPWSGGQSFVVDSRVLQNCYLEVVDVTI